MNAIGYVRCSTQEQADSGLGLVSQQRIRAYCSLKDLRLIEIITDAGDCLTTVEQWGKAKISLRVVDLGGNAIDTTSAAGRFMLVFLAGAAEMDRNLTRAHTKAAMAVNRANGKPIGTIPYGYSLADDVATLLPNESELSVVSEITMMRDKGFTLQRNASQLH